MFKINSLFHVLFLFTATLFVIQSLAQEPACDINNYSNDPADYSDLFIYDLQDYEETNSGWYGTDFVQVGDLDITGSAWITTSWCIPNMDDNACGGENLYIASGVDMTISPQLPVNRIGFDYGSQGSEFNFQVTLSNGTIIDLVHPGPGGWGGPPATGFFGYCTGDPEITIVSIYLTAFDGGIDNLRYGIAGGGDCTLEDLGQTITDLALNHGIEKSLLAQLTVIKSAIEKNNLSAAMGILEAMINHIEAQSGKKIPVEAAESLIECLQSIIDSL